MRSRLRGIGIGVGVLIAVLVVGSILHGPGHGRLDELRDEAIMKHDFPFLIEIDRTETHGYSDFGFQSDEITRKVTFLGVTRKEALDLVCQFALSNGWVQIISEGRSPDARAFERVAEYRPYLLIVSRGTNLTIEVSAT